MKNKKNQTKKQHLRIEHVPAACGKISLSSIVAILVVILVAVSARSCVFLALTRRRVRPLESGPLAWAWASIIPVEFTANSAH